MVVTRRKAAIASANGDHQQIAVTNGVLSDEPRRRTTKSREDSSSIPVPDLTRASAPPRYTIDLSLPPRDRYKALAKAYKHKLAELPILFDEVLANFYAQMPLLYPPLLKFLARLLLRRVYDPEQMEEIRGIHEATAVPIYLLVAFNVLLDMFVGCTSGGVCVADRGEGGYTSKRMLHFRTLDWAMDPLRQVVIELDFVARPGGPVIARSVTYLGFVGVLTGVRPDLSISFNFRANASTYQALSFRGKAHYIGGKLAVLFGMKPSLPSILRKYIVPDTHRTVDGSYAPNVTPMLTRAEVANAFPRLTTAQCFIIASDGDTTTIIEKDWKSAVLREDTSFIACTNHDHAQEGGDPATASDCEDESAPLTDEAASQAVASQAPNTATAVGMDEILSESVERKHHMEQNFARARDAFLAKNPVAKTEDMAVPLAMLTKWLKHDRISSDCTHYAVIMDPKRGEVAWAERFPTPPPETRRWIGQPPQ